MKKWIYFVIEISIPIVVAIYTSATCIFSIVQYHPDFITKALIDLLLSSLTPILVLSFVFIPTMNLPTIRNKYNLSPRWSIAILGLLSIPSVAIACLSPLYSFMRAFPICFMGHPANIFYGPSTLEYLISIFSVIVALIILFRVYNEIRAT